jgi:hypothetical protein
MSEQIEVPRWRVECDGVINGTPYDRGATLRSWTLPVNLVDLAPANASAEVAFAFLEKTFHNPLRPRSCWTRLGAYLPGVIVGLGGRTGFLGGNIDETRMPKFANAGVQLEWPSKFLMTHDRPANQAAEELLAWWREHRSQRAELEAYGCWSNWNLMTDSMFLPALVKREEVEQRLPPGFGTPKPSSYVSSDGRPDAAMVPARPPAPVIKTHRYGETQDIRAGRVDPTGRQ